MSWTSRVRRDRRGRPPWGPAAALCLLVLGAAAATATAQEDRPPRASRATRLALLPPIDLAGGLADLPAVETVLRRRLGEIGFQVIPEGELIEFLGQRRIRHTGGASLTVLDGLREALGAEAVLAASVDLSEKDAPPRIALNARLVSTDSARIGWSGEIALAGEDRPGVLGLKRIDEFDVLLGRAIARLLAPLDDLGLSRAPLDAARHPTWKHADARKRYRPVRLYRGAEFDAPRERPARVAVLPFDNASTSVDAGDVVSALFVTHLAGRRRFDVIEPGEVRDKLLAGRVIQVDGLSLAQADWIREMLDADLAVTGRVTEYVDFGAGSVPRVGFAVWVIDVRRRSVVWSAFSASHGDDGVVFFKIGRVNSARALAGEMVRSAADAMAERKR